MILQCNECMARYLCPDQAIGAKGRTVRCAKCGYQWFQEPTEETRASVNDLDQMLNEINQRPKPIPRGSNLPKIPVQPVGVAHKLATVATAGLAVALILLMSMPSVFGFTRSKGLVLADVGILRVANKDSTSYQLSGKIANASDKPLPVPTLRVTLVDDNGNALQYWDFTGDPAMIKPGKNTPFSTGDLEMRFSKGSRFVVELGNAMELALRRKPE